MFYPCNNIVKVEDYFIIKQYQQTVKSDFRDVNIKNVLHLKVYSYSILPYVFHMSLIKVHISVTKDT